MSEDLKTLENNDFTNRKERINRCNNNINY